MGDMRYGRQGLKTLCARAKEIAVRSVMKDYGKSESEAIKIVESWEKGHNDSDKYVVCDAEKKLILRDKDVPIWHPYIEKALLFDSEIDAEKCIEEMAQKNLLEKLDDDSNARVFGFNQYRYVVGSVRAMTDKNCKYCWKRPFYVQTGIKHKIGYSK